MNIPKKEFEKFKKECLRLQKEWGLSGWELFFQFKPLKDPLAQTTADLESRKATIRLSSELPEEVSENRDVIHSAKHEMIHLLLWRLSACGHTRWMSESEIDEAEEETVMQLLKIIP